MKKLWLLCCFIFLLFFASNIGHATLIDNGGGLIYDSVLGITWYDFTYAGPQGKGETWDQAKAWAESLKVGGVSGWRLPQQSLPANAHPQNVESEMGYLYYIELGNKILQNTTNANPLTGGFANTGPFKNFLPDCYWTGTSTDPRYIYHFNFYYGDQDDNEPATGVQIYYALAVHSGNVKTNK